MKRTSNPTVIYVPTLLDKDGTRLIIPAKDSAAYCGATGSQHLPHDHKASELCQRCVERHMKAVVLDRLKGVGL